jgi:asparaginyl-tRNA synthetase
VVQYAVDHCTDEIAWLDTFETMDKKHKTVDKPSLASRLQTILKEPFKRLTYTEAVDILQKSEVKFEMPVSWGVDLATEHERYIAEQIYKKPVMITDYPKEIKSFCIHTN